VAAPSAPPKKVPGLPTGDTYVTNVRVTKKDPNQKGAIGEAGADDPEWAPKIIMITNKLNDDRACDEKYRPGGKNPK